MKKPKASRGDVRLREQLGVSDATKSKTISADQEYKAALARIEHLMDTAKSGTPQAAELERLVRSLHHYEEKLYPDPVPEPTRIKMIAAAIVKGFKAVEVLRKAEGGAWSSAEIRKRFGFGLAELRRRRERHRIVFWQGAKRAIRYPKWEFTTTGTLLPGVEELLQIFHSPDQWRVMGYFLGPRQQLDGRRPLDLLRAGEIERVLDHARSHAEENTW